MERREKIYSSNQIATAAFLGGPAAIYIFKENFDVLGKRDTAKAVLLWGALLVIAAIGILSFLLDELSYVTFMVVCTSAAWSIAEQCKFDALSEPGGGYDRQPNWKVACICLVGIVIFIGIFVVWRVLLGNWGLITITD